MGWWRGAFGVAVTTKFFAVGGLYRIIARERQCLDHAAADGFFVLDYYNASTWHMASLSDLFGGQPGS